MLGTVSTWLWSDLSMYQITVQEEVLETFLQSEVHELSRVVVEKKIYINYVHIGGADFNEVEICWVHVCCALISLSIIVRAKGKGNMYV